MHVHALRRRGGRRGLGKPFEKAVDIINVAKDIAYLIWIDDVDTVLIGIHPHYG
jgi:hypothetical protein